MAKMESSKFPAMSVATLICWGVSSLFYRQVGDIGLLVNALKDSGCSLLQAPRSCYEAVRVVEVEITSIIVPPARTT